MPDTPTLAPLHIRSRPDLDDAMRALGKMQSEAAHLKLARAKTIAVIEARYAKTVSDLDRAIAEQLSRIRDFIAKNRSLVLGDEKSTILNGGEITIRKRPISVNVVDSERAIQHLVDGYLYAYLRIDTQLDKNALKRDRVPVPGIEYVEGEQLIVIPITSGDQITADL